MASGAVLPKTGLQKLAAGDTLAETDINPIMDAVEANAGNIEAINVMSWTFSTNSLTTVKNGFAAMANNSVRLVKFASVGSAATAGGTAYRYDANNGYAMLKFPAYPGIYVYNCYNGTWTEEHIT